MSAVWRCGFSATASHSAQISTQDMTHARNRNSSRSRCVAGGGEWGHEYVQKVRRCQPVVDPPFGKARQGHSLTTLQVHNKQRVGAPDTNINEGVDGVYDEVHCATHIVHSITQRTGRNHTTCRIGNSTLYCDHSGITRNSLYCKHAHNGMSQ